MKYVSSGAISIDKVYIHPIWADIHFHYIENNLSLLYIYDIQSGEEIIVNIGNIDHHTTKINHVSFNFKEAYVYDKKSFLNIIKLPNLYDAALMKYLQVNEPLKTNQTSCHSFFHRKFPNAKNINNIIPLVKHVESVRETRDEFLKFYNIDIINTLRRFDNFFIESLHGIEINGIYTNRGYEYTRYNPYTITSRPSNTFNGVNYAALNKDDGSRKRFISRHENGKLIQFDYDAYHPRLISRLIKQKIPNDISGHQYLADLYGVERSEAKRITFRQLYGGIQNQYIDIPFFKAVSNYIDLLWTDFEKNGFIETPFGRKFLNTNLRSITKNKLFNYLLQSIETELNMSVICDLNNFLDAKKTKLVLYTYDSYLLDVHPSEFDIINDIKILIEKNGFLANIEMGDNYSDIK